MMPRTRILAGVLLVGLYAAAAGSAAPTASVHEIEFRIHVDLVTPPASENLADYQMLLDDSLAAANAALMGFQGPVDTACCVELAERAPLAIFGAPGDGFNAIEDPDEFDLLFTTFGQGTPQNPIAYIVLSLQACGLVISPSILGCADAPGDTFAFDLDPAFRDGPFLADDESSSALGLTIAHERGHNAGLLHPEDADPPEPYADLCRLMSAAGGAGCLADFECTTFLDDAGVSAGGACPCLDENVGALPVEDGSGCNDGEDDGICSGGLCGAVPGLAELQFVVAGGTEASTSGVPDDLISMSSLTAGWTEGEAIGRELAALVFDPDQDDFVAIGRQAQGNDQLLRVARDGTASVIATLDRGDIVALAWGPGQAFLYAADDTPYPDLLSIDPATGVVTTLGGFNPIPGGVTANGLPFNGVQSLAFDATSAKLYGSTSQGITEIGTGCLPFCTLSFPAVGTPEADFAFHFGLEIDADQGVLIGIGEAPERFDSAFYLIGNLGELQIFDLATGEIRTLEHQAFTAVALTTAPHPVPEPTPLAAMIAAALTLVGLRSIRDAKSSRQGASDA